jgi:RES domain-containing protein
VSRPRVLREPMRTFRIGDPQGRYPIYSGQGAAMVEGRWHKRRQDVIYTSQHYSTAMLEKLVHFNGILPPNQHFIEISIPAGTSYEIVTKDSLPGWTDARRARAFGAVWFEEKRSAILIVPSFVAREETNVLINPNHADAKTIRPGLEKPVWWDRRLADPSR